jgi:hypothetical protein
MCGACEAGFRKILGQCEPCDGFNTWILLTRLALWFGASAFWWLVAQEPVWSRTAVEQLFNLRDTKKFSRSKQGFLSKHDVDTMLEDMGSRHKAHSVIHDLQLQRRYYMGDIKDLKKIANQQSEDKEYAACSVTWKFNKTLLDA